MIKLRNLEKAVKTKAGFTYLLRQINLDIAEGEFVTIMGPSGAGKSTLLSIIGFYDSAWEGEYFLFDQAVHKLAPKERPSSKSRIPKATPPAVIASSGCAMAGWSKIEEQSRAMSKERKMFVTPKGKTVS